MYVIEAGLIRVTRNASIEDNMSKPTLSASKIIKDGKVAGVRFQFCAKGSENADLIAAAKTLGWALVEDCAGVYAVVCATPAEVDAKRNPLIGFFN